MEHAVNRPVTRGLLGGTNGAALGGSARGSGQSAGLRSCPWACQARLIYRMPSSAGLPSPASWVGSSAYCRQGCVSGASHGSDPLNVRYPSIFSPNQPSFLTFGTTPSEQHQSPRPTPIQLFINAFLLLSPDSPPTRRADSHGIPRTRTPHMRLWLISHSMDHHVPSKDAGGSASA